MKRTEYSFGKIDFNESRAVIPTKQKEEPENVAPPFLSFTILLPQ